MPVSRSEILTQRSPLQTYLAHFSISCQSLGHVVMSVHKLLARIVKPSGLAQRRSDGENFASALHHYTFGITSDPLTQFACIFSALIHDVDHSGVANTVLISEKSPLAAYYDNKSVAEQNSIDLAFELLYKPDFENFRRALMPTQEEQRRFRQLVVQIVLATDIMDKDLKKARNERWEKAFAETAVTEGEIIDKNRKATIVIEHLIQASDVAHTMQHWYAFFVLFLVFLYVQPPHSLFHCPLGIFIASGTKTSFSSK